MNQFGLKYGYFMPIKGMRKMPQPIKTKAEYGKRAHCVAFPEEADTARLFVDALSSFRRDDAKALISKNFQQDFDLDELSDFFNRAGLGCYKCLINLEFNPRPKNCKTNSILILNKGQGQQAQAIIHLHMIKEPDNLSNWKIYGIEKE